MDLSWIHHEKYGAVVVDMRSFVKLIETGEWFPTEDALKASLKEKLSKVDEKLEKLNEDAESEAGPPRKKRGRPPKKVE